MTKRHFTFWFLALFCLLMWRRTAWGLAIETAPTNGIRVRISSPAKYLTTEDRLEFAVLAVSNAVVVCVPIPEVMCQITLMDAARKAVPRRFGKSLIGRRFNEVKKIDHSTFGRTPNGAIALETVTSNTGKLRELFAVGDMFRTKPGEKYKLRVVFQVFLRESSHYRLVRFEPVEIDVISAD